MKIIYLIEGSDISFSKRLTECEVLMEAVFRGNKLSGNHSKTHLYGNKTRKDSLSVQ